MSDETRPRRRKYFIWGLVVLALILAYPLGIGPWIYVYPHLPPPMQRLVEFTYRPLDLAYQSDAFGESSVGKLYLDYINWWHERQSDAMQGG